MNTQSMKIAFALLCACAQVIAQPAGDIDVAYKEPLEQLQLTYVNGSSGTQKLSFGSIESLRFNAFGRRFDIELESNHALLNATQRSVLGEQLGIYRGSIAGIDDSWVRLVVESTVPRGILWDGEQMFAIEATDDAVAGVEVPVIFRLEDLQIPPGMLSCSQPAAVTNAAELAEAVLAEIAALGPGATSQLNMAVIGDFEFTSAKGANADTALITRMNNVDGFFSAQLGVQLNINRIDTFANANDPFTDEADAGLLLDELANFRQSTPSQNTNGLTHLFTGRILDTSTVGIAYTGALCSVRFGAGLTQGTHSVTTDSLIAAHEIGHNFGAPHDGTSGSACDSEPQTFLMAPQINGSSTFSSCSITQMQDDVNRAACITPLPSTDVALVAGSQPGTVLLGNPATFTLEANSVGTMTATGVVVDVSIPANVSLSSVSTTAGTCTSGAGSVSCAIGSIAAGTGVTISITVATLAAGNADFVGNIAAVTDANSNNNQATVRVIVNPAVDLISTAAASAQIAVDGSTTIQPSVENRSSIAATGVNLTVTPDAGLRIDSASWAPGNCSIDSNMLTCQASSLAAGATEILQVQVTGISAGSRSYTMAIVAAESDSNTSNNNATGQVTVGSGGGEPDSGGGGAFEWFTLSLLFFSRLPAVFVRRRRPIRSHRNLHCQQ